MSTNIPTTQMPALDLNHLEALTLAATPGTWEWWTSNSVLRLSADDGIDGGVLHAYSHRGHADIFCGESDRAFIAALSPATVKQLITLARRAQPESEASQASVAEFMVPKFEGQFDSHQDWVNRASSVLTGRREPAVCIDAKGRRCHIGADMRRAKEEDAFPVRYFWECEMTAPAAGDFRTCCDHPDCSTCAGRGGFHRVAAQSQGAHGADVIGGHLWSKEAEMMEGWLAAQQAAAPDALLAILRDVHDTLASESDSDIDHFEDDEEEREGAPVQYAARKVMEIIDLIEAETRGAPSTTEAVADPIVEANRKLLLERSSVGIGKYGKTLADADLTAPALVQHALEEALDLANYLQAILRKQRIAELDGARGDVLG